MTIRGKTPRARWLLPNAGIAWPYRYELLDGLRGIAALLVVMHHVGIIYFGHFAVMIFFVISGYCITAAAASCLNRGIRFKTFMIRRVRRIYPAYLLALVFFLVTRLIKIRVGGHDDLSTSVLDWIQNLTLTQWLTLLFHPQPWAQQNPTLFVAAFWSLNYEEQFYLVMALCIVVCAKLRISLAVPISLLAIIAVGFNIERPGDWICGIFLEYWAHFALGSFLFFVLCQYTARRTRRLFIMAMVAIGASFALQVVPWSNDYMDTRRAFVELAFAVVVTAGLFALRPWSAQVARSALWKPFAALGAISYSLYLIHQFNLTLVNSIANALLPATAPQILLRTFEVMIHIALAAVFWALCERPFVRGFRPKITAAAPAAEQFQSGIADSSD